MKDFDFEELDKAVSSAIGSDDDQQADEIPNVQPSTPQRVVSPAARRSTGRFMDMVHTSSDMRRPSQSLESRPAASPTQAQTSEDFVNDEDEDDLFDYNGPLSLSDAPLQSPFIPNAVVEKRPLGPVASIDDTLASDTPLEELFEEPDYPLLEEGPETLLLEETDEPDIAEEPLQPEQVEPMEELEQPEQLQAVAVEEATPEEPSTFDEPVESRDSIAEAAEPETETVSTEALQVHPQEVEKPQPSAVYDTEAYHAPAVAQKKKSSVWTVIWVFLLIILGAAAGAAVYFFVLPLL